MIDFPRVAFFPDSYLEVNGAAMTCKRLVNFARDNERPLLCIYAGPDPGKTIDGSVTNFESKRSPISFSLDEGLAYDPFFQRHSRKIERELREFKPDVIHITGLNDVSISGAYLAWKLGIPMIASWHTNLHEFAASRIRRTLRFLPETISSSIANTLEHRIMQGCVLYYKMPKVILSPNAELVEELGRRTKRMSRLMARGVDSDFFSPSKRTVNDGIRRIGFVGRLRAEKNVKLLVELEKDLINAGLENFRFLIVGEGTERGFLEQNMQYADFTGFLDGDELASAYANMDIFIFPSETDAFGNVAQEANASGVPAIVSDKGGPKFIISPGKTGFVANTKNEFAEHTVFLLKNSDRLMEMKKLSRETAMSRSWNSIFEGVYDAYRTAIESSAPNTDPERAA